MPLLLALGAVIGLIGLVRLLGFAARPVLADAAQAADLAQALPGGFAPVETVLAEDRAGALLRDAAGRVAVVAPFGAHFLVRLDEGDWQVARASDGLLMIAGRDFSCRLALGSAAPPWLSPS